MGSASLPAARTQFDEEVDEEIAYNYFNIQYTLQTQYWNFKGTILCTP